MARRNNRADDAQVYARKVRTMRKRYGVKVALEVLAPPALPGRVGLSTKLSERLSA